MSQLGTAPLRWQLLVYPVTDVRCNTRSYWEFRDGPWLTAAGMRWFIDHYLSGGERTAGDPLVSPLLAWDLLDRGADAVEEAATAFAAAVATPPRARRSARPRAR